MISQTALNRQCLVCMQINRKYLPLHMTLSGNMTNWLNVNKLQSNSSKIKIMVTGSRANLNSKVGNLCFSVTMNNKTLTSVTPNKCLRTDLEERLAFDIYIKELCKIICSVIGVLRRIKPFVSLDFRLTIYKSSVQPYFDYCFPLWDTCNKSLKDKLQMLQNFAARVITGTTYDATILVIII